MIDKHTICQSIRDIYPDIGECGIELSVDFDEENDAWVVELEKNGRKLIKYIDKSDTDACLINENCIGLGVEIAQLQDQGNCAHQAA